MRRKSIKFGILLEDTANLTNLRFADDVILVAQGMPEITEMLSRFAESSRRYDLKIYFGKTKIMACDSLASRYTSAKALTGGIAVLKEHEVEK